MYSTPFDEYYFWKSLIEEKQDAYETVPDQMFEMIDMAERKILFYLIEKYYFQPSPTADNSYLLH